MLVIVVAMTMDYSSGYKINFCCITCCAIDPCTRLEYDYPASSTTTPVAARLPR